MLKQSQPTSIFETVKTTRGTSRTPVVFICLDGHANEVVRSSLRNNYGLVWRLSENTLTKGLTIE